MRTANLERLQSTHYDLHVSKNLTTQQAGNSPVIIHQHYKLLSLKKRQKNGSL